MEQKDSRRYQDVGAVPGRRYNPRTVRPRAGFDVVPQRPRMMRPVTSAAPVTEKAPVQTLRQEVSTKPAGTMRDISRHKKRAVSKAKPALPRTSKSVVLKRQMVERATYQRKVQKAKKRINLVGYMIATVVALSAGTLLWTFREATPLKVLSKTKQVVQPATITATTQTSEVTSLDETMVTKGDIAANKLADDAPNTLRIPSLSIEARIKPVGSTLDGQPIAPANIFDVGWFEAGGKPGQPGAVLLNGHTSGPTKKGSFEKVRTLQPGATVEVERGDGKTIKYEVVRVQEYPFNEIDMRAATVSIDATKEGLNLLTTANRFQDGTTGIERRVIVYCTRILTQ